MKSVWLRIAWRNVWRNPKRTAITVGALAIGFAAATVMVGLSDGIVAQMIENGTGLLSGQIQLHQNGYKPERSLYSTVGGSEGTDLGALLATLQSDPSVVGVAPRIYAGGLVSSGDETSAASFIGLVPDRERSVTRILDTLEDGRLPEPGARELMVGTEMARKLRVEVGAELVIVAGAADGSMANDRFILSGVYRTGSVGLDGAFAFFDLATLQEFLVMDPSRIHEIAIGVDQPWAAAEVAERLQNRTAALDLDVTLEPWIRFQPDLAEYAQLAASSNWLIVGTVFVMAIFGVANTMLMATWERRREFAVVRALGAPGRGVVGTVVLETLVLGTVALGVGVLLTAPIILWWSAAPPDLGWIVGDFSMAGAMVSANLRVDLSIQGPLFSAIGLMVTVLLAGIYPAVRSARQPPADILAGAD